MPELPEVQTIASDLDDVVGGKTIAAVAVSFDKIVASDLNRFHKLLTGATIDSVTRLGKWVCFSLSGTEGPVTMLAHLKMTGQFHLGAWPEGESDWPPHTRAAFRLKGLPAENDTLFYKDIRKFGRLRAFDLMELEEFLEHLGLGPDPFDMEPDDFYKRLTSKKGRLKSVLLNQQVVAGLGNIYVDECLFASGLLPTTSACKLSRPDTDRILTEARRILAASIKARGSTTSNYEGLKGGGSFQKSHNVYGRAGEPCPVCGSPIEKSVVGGRGTHHCPHCQRGRLKSGE
ncbi:DNA-formamidopyrimidine glycosylase [Deltaproteobacteria bacterium Smac51]|nr:DNA-formamidopyrimidine glycosylase [Deltaproteobacteria bacterium Smac51]